MTNTIDILTRDLGDLVHGYSSFTGCGPYCGCAKRLAEKAGIPASVYHYIYLHGLGAKTTLERGDRYIKLKTTPKPPKRDFAEEAAALLLSHERQAQRKEELRRIYEAQAERLPVYLPSQPYEVTK